MTNEKHQGEMARRLASIDGSLKQLVKVFDAMNTNIVAAVKALQERVIHSSIEELNVDPEQTELNVDPYHQPDLTLGDENPLRRLQETTRPDLSALGDRDKNGD